MSLEEEVENIDRDALKSLIKEAFDEHASSIAVCRPAGKDCPFSEDDLFLIHRFVSAWNGATKLIGSAILLGILAGVGYLIKIGVETWRAIGVPHP